MTEISKRYEYSEGFAAGYSACLRHYDRYKWHDLRKNPNDVPIWNNKAVAYEVVYDPCEKASCTHGFEYWYGNSWSTSWKIIAWRERELFEEDE